MPEIVEAIMVEDGFVEFEYIGTKQYLKERGFTRGANCTSIDAAMLGVTSHNERVLFLIEWKYTEIYKKEDKYIPERAKVYDALIKNPDGPFKEGIEPKSLYYEPFYQMMRQTLLGWYFVRNKELGCSKCINLHVIPEDNLELKETITSPGLSGKNIHQAWKKILKWPELYVSIDPSEFIKAAEKLNDSQSWIAYLRNRYW
jgi:hypothetical protein